jgi:YD repeat-containing protein
MGAFVFAAQMINFTIPGTGSINYTYNWTSPTTVTLPGGTKREYTYDPLMRIKSINVTDPAQNPIMSYQYAYDPMNNITKKQTEHGLYEYAYDPQYQLIAATYPAINITGAENNNSSLEKGGAEGGGFNEPAYTSETFTYDNSGNRTAHTTETNTTSFPSASIGNPVVMISSTNANNELLTANNQTQLTTYEYDENGNTIAEIIRSTDNIVIREQRYTYDNDNRLVQAIVTRNNVVITTSTYYYDTYARRLCKEVNGTRTYFIYADEGLIAEANAQGTIAKTYGYVPDSIWTTNPLWQNNGGDYAYYNNDHLGTPQQMTSQAGAVVWQGRAEPFGKTVNSNLSIVKNNLGNSGQY